MERQNDQSADVPLRWPLRDVIYAASELRRAGGLMPSEEWPDIVLEDILDAEYITEDKV